MTDADDLGEPHWISVIFALDQNDVVISLRRLASHDATPASHEFEIPGGVGLRVVVVWVLGQPWLDCTLLAHTQTHMRICMHARAYTPT